MDIFNGCHYTNLSISKYVVRHCCILKYLDLFPFSKQVPTFVIRMGKVQVLSHSDYLEATGLKHKFAKRLLLELINNKSREKK